MTTKTFTTFVDHPSDWHTTDTVTLVGKFAEAASLLISNSISKISDKKTAVRITNTTQSPYLINKNTQITEFSVVTPEQSKLIRPVETAVRITNTTQSPYLINKNTQITEFSVVTPEQSKLIRPVDTAILSMIPEGDPGLTTYLSEVLRKKTRSTEQYLVVPDTRKSWHN